MVRAADELFHLPAEEEEGAEGVLGVVGPLPLELLGMGAAGRADDAQSQDVVWRGEAEATEGRSDRKVAHLLCRVQFCSARRRDPACLSNLFILELCPPRDLFIMPCGSFLGGSCSTTFMTGQITCWAGTSLPVFDSSELAFR